MKSHSTHEPYAAILASQIELAGARRPDVAPLTRADAERDEALADAVANDLVGARLVMRAALSGSPPAGVSGAAREELEPREREVKDLLGVVLAVLRRDPDREAMILVRMPVTGTRTRAAGAATYPSPPTALVTRTASTTARRAGIATRARAGDLPGAPPRASGLFGATAPCRELEKATSCASRAPRTGA